MVLLSVVSVTAVNHCQKILSGKTPEIIHKLCAILSSMMKYYVVLLCHSLDVNCLSYISTLHMLPAF